MSKISEQTSSPCNNSSASSSGPDGKLGCADIIYQQIVKFNSNKTVTANEIVQKSIRLIYLCGGLHFAAFGLTSLARDSNAVFKLWPCRDVK